MKKLTFFLLILLISCASDSDVIYEYEDEIITRKDISMFIKNTDKNFEQFASVNTKNLFAEYLTFKNRLKDISK